MNKSMFAVIRPLCLALFISVYTNSVAQQNSPDYKNNPEWIKMIDNPDANYFEAIKAYETYWMYHEKPENEEETFKENEELMESEKMNSNEMEELQRRKKEKEDEINADSKKVLTEEDRRQLEEKREMTYHCKRFENWIREVKPYVQNDGRILTMEERMEIYKKQVEEQRKQ